MDAKNTKLPVEGQWSTGLFDCFDDINNCNSIATIWRTTILFSLYFPFNYVIIISNLLNMSVHFLKVYAHAFVHVSRLDSLLRL